MIHLQNSVKSIKAIRIFIPEKSLKEKTPYVVELSGGEGQAGRWTDGRGSHAISALDGGISLNI